MSSEPSNHEDSPQPAPSQPAPQLPPAPPQSFYKPPKSPGLALVLSLLLPGVGQIYNGQPAKAFVFFFSLVASIYGAAEIDPFPFAFLIPFVILYNLIDAWRSATIINAKAAGGAPPEEDDAESPAWGASLVVLGGLLLLNNLGWIRLAALQRFWPALLIVAGGIFVYHSIRKRESKELGGDKKA